MSVEQIINLLEFCLNTTYFQFQGRFFEQVQREAMGSPISPTVANLYMEALNPRPSAQQNIHQEYGRGIFVVIKSSKKEKFPEHINKMDPHIHFTTEVAKADGSIPFLDTLVRPQSNNSLFTSVYRKPTDLYLQWDSHHHLAAKFRIINIFKHKAKTVCFYNYLLKEEKDHLRQALKDAGIQHGL